MRSIPLKSLTGVTGRLAAAMISATLGDSYGRYFRTCRRDKARFERG